MLKELKLSNLAIIKKMSLDIDSNFISLTGETGAGKSIVLDGISLLLGDRSNIENIRSGEESLYSECVIKLNDKQLKKLQDKGYDIDDDELIITRSFNLNSISKVSINGKRSKVNTLKEIMENIVDLVGQNNNKYLLDDNYHKEIFDKFLDNESKKIKEKVSSIYKKYKNINQKLFELEKKISDTLEKKDLYIYQINEIESVSIKEDEDEKLEKIYQEMLNSTNINESIENILYLLKYSDTNIIDFLKNIEFSFNSLKKYDDKYSNYENEISEIRDKILDIFNDLENSAEKSNYEYENLEEVIDKIEKIKVIKKKYGPTLKDVLINYENIKDKINNLEIDYETFENLKKEKVDIVRQYKEESVKLRNKRKEIAQKLEENINSEFLDLNMKYAEFKVELKLNNVINENGIDDIKFYIKTNAGDDFKPLSKIASGGEISRIMLALKIIFSRVDDISVLIFDEIDTGISGNTVNIVAKKLKELSKTIQIICVTHSPHLAAYSDTQLYIYKDVKDSKTETHIKKLNQEERINEIARIISGENITKNSLEYARDLIFEGMNYGK